MIFAILTLLSWTAGTFAFLTASRKIYPALLNRVRLGLAAVITFAAACIYQGVFPWQLVLQPSVEAWIFLGLSGIVGLTVGDYFGFTALRILGARRHSVIATTAPIFAALGAFVFVGESITVSTLIGMLICIGGVLLAMSSARERQDVEGEGYGSYTMGLLTGLGAAVGQGIGLVLAKLGMQSSGIEVDPLQATFMRMAVGFLSTYVLDLTQRGPLRPLSEAFVDKEGRNGMFLGVLFGPTLGVTMSLAAAATLDLAVAQTIFSMTPVVITLVAILRERRFPPLISLVGLAVAIAGVVILVAG